MAAIQKLSNFSIQFINLVFNEETYLTKISLLKSKVKHIR